MRGRPRHKSVADDYLGGEDETEVSLTADRGIYVSQDGLRRTDELLNVAHKKRRLNPSQLNDPLASWIPVPDDLTEEGVDVPAETVIQVEAIGARKHKECASTVSEQVFPFG